MIEYNARYEHDSKAKAMYIHLSENKIKDTIPVKNAEVYLDLDDKDNLVGIEILLLNKLIKNKKS
jgi:uncharacterized protein YuzE